MQDKQLFIWLFPPLPYFQWQEDVLSFILKFHIENFSAHVRRDVKFLGIGFVRAVMSISNLTFKRPRLS